MHEITRQIVQRTEAKLIGRDIKNGFWRDVLGWLIFPAFYLIAGFEEKAKKLFRFSFLVLFFFILVEVLIVNYHGPSLTWKSHIVVSIVFSTVFMVFALPSSYAFYDNKKGEINFVKSLFQEYGIGDERSISLLESALEKVQMRIDEKISLCKWVITTVWATFLFYLGIIAKLFDINEPKNQAEFLSQAVSYTAILLMCTLVAWGIVSSYVKSSSRLMMLLNFSCIDYRYDLLEKGVKNSQSPTASKIKNLGIKNGRRLVKRRSSTGSDRRECRRCG